MSPYSVTAAARYLLVTEVEFALGSDHAEAPCLRSEALERLATIILAQLAPPLLRYVARLAVDAVQWTPPSDTGEVHKAFFVGDAVEGASVQHPSAAAPTLRVYG